MCRAVTAQLAVVLLMGFSTPYVTCVSYWLNCVSVSKPFLSSLAYTLGTKMKKLCDFSLKCHCWMTSGRLGVSSCFHAF